LARAFVVADYLRSSYLNAVNTRLALLVAADMEAGLGCHLAVAVSAGLIGIDLDPAEQMAVVEVGRQSPVG